MAKRAYKTRRWVVKVGSNLICDGGPLLMRSWMMQIAELRKKHRIEVVWVTSGAIASAVERTEFKKTTRSLPEKQALSAIGQPLLMDLYNHALQAVGLVGAQILLTYEDIKNDTRRGNLQNTLETLLKWKVVPLLNENDAVSTDEIKFGDNDSLSAKVACMLKADRLVILTDVLGLYDKDPVKYKNAKLIHHVRKITDKVLNTVGKKSGSQRGTGGMYSKLSAAREAGQNKINTNLVKGDINRILLNIAENKTVGTFVGETK